MSEEYTQGKAYLDKLCRSGSKQESPYNPLMGLEPASVMITRLTAERAEANKWVSAYLLERNEAHEESERLQRRNDVQAETIDFLQKQNKTISDERDEARAKRDQWAKRSIEIAKERDTAQNRLGVQAETITFLQGETDRLKAESAKHEGLLKAAQQLLLSRGNELLAARSSNIALRDELANPQDRKPVQHPAGRIEAIEDRLAKLERLSTAR